MCKTTLCRISIVSQAQTTSVSLGQTSSEVHSCRLGSSSFHRRVKVQFKAIRWAEPCVSEKGERYNDVCVRERGQFGGGSVMVWAGISLHTKTPLIPIHQNLNAARYQNIILLPVAIPHITANRGMVLMQDNATPHTARTTQQVLQGYNIRVLDWPPCSPDLNPIEHVWDEIDRRVRQFPQPQNLVDLERDLVNIWNNLPQRFLFNYVNSMRSRCLAVVRAIGGHTRY